MLLLDANPIQTVARRLLLTAAVVSGLPGSGYVTAQDLPGAQIEIARGTPGGRVPKFSNGLVFVKDHADGATSRISIAVHGPGVAPLQWSAQDPQGRMISVADVAAGDDGGGVVSTAAGAGSAPREFRLWVFAPGGHLTGSFVIDPFAARLVAVDRHGFIWCFGAMGNRDDDPQGSQGVFRRYTKDGALTGEFVPRSTFQSPLSPATHAGGDRGLSFLAATRDGIAAFNAPTLEWIELNLEGEVQIRKRAGLPEGKAVYAFARLDNGAVFFQQLNGGTYRWHPESGTFDPQPGLKGRIVGGHRDSLVVERWSASSRTMEWFRPATAKAAP